MTALLKGIENRLPELVDAKTLIEYTEYNLKPLPGRGEHTTSVDDILENIERKINDRGDAPVPTKNKPKPKGLIGGASVALPDGDALM